MTTLEPGFCNPIELSIPAGVSHTPVRRVAEGRLKRSPLQTDRARIAIREPLDPRILLPESHAARQQHQRGVERHSAELDREPAAVTRIHGHVPRRPLSTGNPPQHGQHYTALRQYRLRSAPHPPARVRARRAAPAPCRPRLPRVDEDTRARITGRFRGRALPAADAGLLDPRGNAVRRRLLSGRRRTAVRPRDERTPRRGAGPLPARAPAPYPDATGQPQY